MQINALAQAQVCIIASFTNQLGIVFSTPSNVVPGFNSILSTRVVGQAQASIKTSVPAYAQTQAKVKQTYSVTGQAIAFVGGLKLAQAAARIVIRVGPITIQQAKFQQGNVSTLNFTYPPTIGNVMVSWWGRRDGAAPVPTPSGWTLISSGSAVDGSWNGAMFYRVVQSGDLGISVASIQNSGSIIELSGVQPYPDVNATQNNQNSTTPNAGGALTPTASWEAAVLIAGMVADTSADNVFTPTSTNTIELGDASLFGGFHPNTWVAHRTLTSVTPASSYQITTSSGFLGWAGSTVMFVPISGTHSGQAQALIISLGFGQAQALINQALHVGQAQAFIRPRVGLGQAQARIGAVRISQEAVEVAILPTSANVRTSQFAVEAVVINDAPNVRFSQFVIEVIVEAAALTQGKGQAQAYIKLIRNGFGQAQAKLNAFNQNVFGQTQVKLNAFNQNVFGQTQAYIINSIVVAQAQAALRTTVLQAGQGQTDVKATSRQYGQALAAIKHSGSGQAQAQLIAFDVNRYGQAVADIRTYDNNVYGQARVKITKQQGNAQAQAQIKNGRAKGYGQARVRIGHSWTGQAQADILKLAGYGQANADIKARSSVYAQAVAQIQGWKFSSQAQADIKNTYNAYAQAQALMNVHFGFSNAQADILQVYNPTGNAQADIKQTYSSLAQAQAIIYYRVRVPAQAQALIRTIRRGYGQAQTQIGAFKFAQAQAKLIGFDVPKVGQAMTYILGGTTTPTIPTSGAYTYLVQFNGKNLPGYAQQESIDSIMSIKDSYAYYRDGSLSEYIGLTNKIITMNMRLWEPTYQLCKIQLHHAATILRSSKSFSHLYIQHYNRYYVAITSKISTQKSVSESQRILDYAMEFETKPWLISNEVYEISGTGLIDTGDRPLALGGWTPTTITVSGTDVTITAYTEFGDDAGQITINGNCTDLVIDTETFTATENSVNRNAIIENKNYAIYVGPGKTYFQIDGATSCVIRYQNRWYL